MKRIILALLATTLSATASEEMRTGERSCLKRARVALQGSTDAADENTTSPRTPMLESGREATHHSSNPLSESKKDNIVNLGKMLAPYFAKERVLYLSKIPTQESIERKFDSLMVGKCKDSPEPTNVEKCDFVLSTITHLNISENTTPEFIRSLHKFFPNVHTFTISGKDVTQNNMHRLKEALFRFKNLRTINLNLEMGMGMNFNVFELFFLRPNNPVTINL
jgi:hypothetical protein